MAEEKAYKVRLRHLNGNLRRPPTRPPKIEPDEIIQKNLEPLKHNTKKKFAQTLYYQNHPEQHRSPMNRDMKGPVRQRLGVQQKLRRLVPLGTSTSSILPKKRFSPYPMLKQNNNNQMQFRNTPNQFKVQKMQRVHSVQARLDRIRRHQNNIGSPIKLRRLNNRVPPASNLTVQVKNPNFVAALHNGFNGGNQFKMTLNQEIQAEIAEIQSESTGPLGPLPPSTRITPVMTEIPMNIRFGEL